jgi:microcystin-dependent protein
MSNCNNCFNGCTEPISDQCVRYTGLDVPLLGINNGDTLVSVELALTTYLLNALNGSGIIPIVDPEIICNTISKYFVECIGCDGLSLNELLTAMIKAVCDLQTQINTTNSKIDLLEGNYTIGCLTGVTTDAGTHDVLQATIDKLCLINTALTGVINSLNTFVTIDSINDYIAAYIADDPVVSLISNRMVPYSVVEYYGNKTGPGSPNFDITGAGTGDWAKIYLCNGQNGTPDKRGVVGVGTTDGSMGGLTIPDIANPSTPGANNPIYVLGAAQGTNNVTLNITQIPSHTHTTTVTVTDPGHKHGINTNTSDTGNTNRQVQGGDAEDTGASINQILSATTGITVGVSNAPIGGGLPHLNYQPSLPCYYIQYRP